MEQTLHPRTEKNLKTLSDKTARLARQFMLTVNSQTPPNVEFRIISGSRTWQQQDALFMQGRGYSLEVINRARRGAGMDEIGAKEARTEVTKARGGQSNHNFGIAFDVGVFINGIYQEESIWYDKAGPVGEKVGLEWGGRWKSPVDKPHYQLKTGLSLAQLRQRHSQGLPIG